MDLNEYQNQASKTAIYPEETEMSIGLIYTALKLAGEAGEYVEKVGKIIRDKGGVISHEDASELAKELGDIQWYLSENARKIGYSLETIAELNLAKLESRQKRNKLQGEGDNR